MTKLTIISLSLLFIVSVSNKSAYHKTKNERSQKPTNSTITYNETNDSMGWHIRIADDFKTSAKITDGRTFDVAPTWSPDKNHIAFIRGSEIRLLQLELWTTRYDGSRKKKISPDSLYCDTPRWSPNGEKIVFKGIYGNQQSSIYVIDSTGKNLTHITDSSFTKKFFVHIFAYPDWSSDGKSLIFSCRTIYGESLIGITNLESKSFYFIPNIDFLNPYSARWSPTRGEIIFTGKDKNSNLVCIYRVNLDGSNLICLTPDGGSRGAWSADGNKVIYLKLNIKGDEIESRSFWWVSRDGYEQKQLSLNRSEGLIELPDW